MTLKEAISLVPEKVYGAAMTPEKYIFTVFPDSIMADGRTVDKSTGELGWQTFEEWVKEVNAGRVTNLEIKKLKKAS